MTTPVDPNDIPALRAAFQMPSPATMVSRISSITNAFVGAIIPVIEPTVEEIAEALALLGMSVSDVRCAYCGDKASEWDHLRPLVLDLRPTGYISEIANLVPACGKCNQSKGNKDWRTWILSKTAKLSPTFRGVADVPRRAARLNAYERWKPPTKVDFGSIVGTTNWDHYWSLWESVKKELRDAQHVADALKARIKAGIDKPI